VGTLCALLPLTTVGGESGARQAGSARANDHRPREAAGLRLAAQTSDALEPPARDTPGLGPGGGIDRVLLRFEGPVSASLTALAESDLRTAFGRRGVEIDRPDVRSSTTSTPASGVVLTIVITNERLEQAALKLEEKSPAISAAAARPPSAVAPGDDAAAIVFTLGRRLDLNAFPPDGRMLALVVAADEMLVAAGTEHWRHVRAASHSGVEPSTPGAGETEAAPAPPPPTSAAANAAGPRREEVQEPPATAIGRDGAQQTVQGELGQDRQAPIPWRRDGLATTFAFDRFGGGQTHLGLDLTWRRRLGGRWHASLAAQGRQGRTITTTSGTIDARLLGGRLALGLTLVDDGGRLWLTLDVGARAGGLRFEGRGTAPDGRRTGHQVDTLLAYADTTLALDVRLGRSPLALRLAVGGGLPLLAQDAALGGSAVTGASGAAFESQAGLALSF